MTRGRKTLVQTDPVGPEFVGKTPDAMAKQEIQLYQAQEQRESAIRLVALRVGYQLPADCIDADLIQRDISANMRRSVEACLEVGRGLRVLKEACEHGNFIARLDVLGIDRKVAVKFMQASTKFANVSSTRHLLEAAGNQTKLFEMLVLDDEQIEELELTGQTGELSLDDVATMSVKELRAAVREERQEKADIERIAAQRRDELEKLKIKGRKTKQEPWPNEVAGLKDDLNTLSKVLDEALGKHLTIIDATEAEVVKLDPEERSGALDGYKTVVHHLAEQIERICTLAAGLRFQYDTRLAGFIELDKTFVLPDPDAE